MLKIFNNLRRRNNKNDDKDTINILNTQGEDRITVSYIKEKMSNCSDMEYRPIKIGHETQIDAHIFYIDGMVDSSFIAESVLKPLIMMNFQIIEKTSIHQSIINQLFSASHVETEKNPNSIIMKLLTGNIIILIENDSSAIIVDVKKWTERAVEEAKSETVVKGQRSGFVENIRVNTTLIRRLIKNPNLKIEKIMSGRVTNTEFNVLYIEGIVMEGLVEEVKSRIEKIDIDGYITVGTLQELIDDSTYSIFSQSYSTERPDRACSCLLEGRVVVLMDNSPFVLVMPTSLQQFLQSPDDYNTNYITASFVRLIRFFGLNVTLILPALFVAIFSYHHEMIPTELLKTVTQSREALPFPIFLEMLILEFSFELLREAGVRLPRPVGQAVSIVGALVIGQAAVTARLVSPPSIIIVALTAISSFSIPTTEVADAYRILRFFILILGGVLGLPGIIFALLIILIHISGLRSFGIPYLSPISPLTLSDWKDFIIKLPVSYFIKRPIQTAKKNLKRQKN